MSRKTNGNMATILGRRVDFSDQAGSRHVVKVHFEKNLSKFSFLDDNRNIDKRHVAMLVISIQRYGQLMPIVVNESLEVIEGQHRLEACRELGIPVAYIISVKSSSKDVAVMNNSQKAWKNKDFLKHFSHKNHGNCATYKRIGKFFKDYPLPFAIGILLLAGKNPDPNIGNSRGPMPSFRDGTFRILDYETAEVKAAQLVKMKSFIPQLIRISKFCAAFLKVSTLEKFSITTCYAQMKKYNIRFGHPGNLEEWIEQFVDVYNYRIAKSKKLSLRVEGF